MVIVRSLNKIPIRLSLERWDHITSRHPELESQKERVLETVSNPEIVLKGDFGELLAVRLFSNTPLTEKYLVAAYREISKSEGFILTAYFTNKPQERRKVLWKQ